MLEIGLRNCLLTKQRLQDALSRMQRERDRDLRNFKKMEMQLKIAQDSLDQVRLHYDRVFLEVCIDKLDLWFGGVGILAGYETNNLGQGAAEKLVTHLLQTCFTIKLRKRVACAELSSH